MRDTVVHSSGNFIDQAFLRRICRKAKGSLVPESVRLIWSISIHGCESTWGFPTRTKLSLSPFFFFLSFILFFFFFFCCSWAPLNRTGTGSRYGSRALFTTISYAKNIPKRIFQPMTMLEMSLEKPADHWERALATYRRVFVNSTSGAERTKHFQFTKCFSPLASRLLVRNISNIVIGWNFLLRWILT